MATYNNQNDNDSQTSMEVLQSRENLEKLLDKIAEALIQSQYVDSLIVTNNQKTIRNGIIQTNRTGDDRLVLYQKDVKANIEDLQEGTVISNGLESIDNLQNIANGLVDSETLETTSINIIEYDGGEGDENIISIILNGGEPYENVNITNLVIRDGEFSNTSQFMPIQQLSSTVDIETANEYLDTNIFELLPTADTRQARIIRFFQELNALLPINEPSFDEDGDGRVDVNQTGDWIGGEQYSLDNSITFNGDDGYIHRIKNLPDGDTNSARTIEDIYNRIEPYLKDILEEPISLGDERPTYQNKSDGYLQFRNLNQGIIIRNANQEFIEGLNPNNPTWLNTGFTISMWVKFLDKSSQGTLFNFGNPTREENPFGFKLETYVIDGNETPTRNGFLGSEGAYLSGFGSTNQTWKQIFQNGGFEGLSYGDSTAAAIPNQDFFENTDIERFVRLVINDDGRIRGSHIGMPFMSRRAGLPEFGNQDYYSDPEQPLSPYDHAYGLMTNVRIPMDFQEWYFINATYNPDILEDGSHQEPPYESYKYNPDFWKNNINIDTGNFDSESPYGARCKVEIISRSDLLRARGFKV